MGAAEKPEFYRKVMIFQPISLLCRCSVGSGSTATGVVTFDLLTSTNPSTIAANIALVFPEAYGNNVNVLIATGLILFVVTFAVNALARWFVNRRKEFSGAN